MTKRILCIEDERFISELYARALSNAEYEVKVIDDGVAGLEEAIKGNYDLILLDIMLPSLSGVDILYKIKDARNNPDFKSKIIITTNLDQEEEVRKEVETLADGYLIKAEITPRELVKYVGQALNQTH